MHRTEGDNHVNNEFTNGPPATTINDDWLNSVQEEIAAVIESESITLKTAATETNTQLLEALDARYSGRLAAAPATAGSAGAVGQIAFDATHIYICIAANTWIRADAATW